jgi:hypothetical protein
LLLQFCLSQSPDPTNFHNDKSLASRLVRDCAHLCVSNAQAIISLIDDHYKPDGSIGLISVWWYRVYYVHLAATVLIAAKLHPELSTQLEILESWEQALSILQVHSHFSPFIAQSVSNLQQVSTKVWESQTLHMQDGSTPAGGTPSAVMEDLFRDIGYDPLNPTFGIEDMQWLDISMLHQ